VGVRLRDGVCVCVCVCVRLCATIYLGKSSLLLILTDFETAEGLYMYIYLHIYTHAYMDVKYYAISSCMLVYTKKSI
jgi:hypothetical protein